KKDFANDHVYGIDYDHTIAKVAKAYMLIWGDGRANIAVADSLNEDFWDADVMAKFTSGKGKIRAPRQFNVIATNPPFAGDQASEATISKYELAVKDAKAGKKRVSKIARDKLFIER